MFSNRLVPILILILAAVILLPGVAAADSGTLIVLNKSDNNVSLINLATKKAVATIPTGVGPHEVAVSPNGKIAVVANYGTGQAPGSSLTVIDVPGKNAAQDHRSRTVPEAARN